MSVELLNSPIEIGVSNLFPSKILDIYIKSGLRLAMKLSRIISEILDWQVFLYIFGISNILILFSDINVLKLKRMFSIVSIELLFKHKYISKFLQNLV